MGWKRNITENVVLGETHSPSISCMQSGAQRLRPRSRNRRPGFSAFGDTYSRRETVFCFNKNGNWEGRTKFNICQNTEYIKTLCCFLLIPQEIRFHGCWGRKGMKRELRRSRNVLTRRSLSTVKLSPLNYSL